MNRKFLNTVNLDGGVIIKGGGGGGVTINNQEKSVDITENGTTEVVADAGFTGLSKVVVNTNVASSGGGSGWTGHADAEGLRAIGWTDEDIAYYQANGVNWNEEDDEYHKVTDDNKALYGVLTADNIQTYRDRIVYLPKIDTSAKTNMYGMFSNCSFLVAIPQLDTAKVTGMENFFRRCHSLVSFPPLDTSNVIRMNSMCDECYSLVSFPPLDTSNVTGMASLCNKCYSLVSFPPLDTSNVAGMDYIFNSCYSLKKAPPLNLSKCNSASYLFYNAYCLESCGELDVSGKTNLNVLFTNNYCLVDAKLKGVCANIPYLNNSVALSKESLLYLINNEAAASAITIKLSYYAYTRLAEDADVVAALANHPNISLAK